MVKTIISFIIIVCITVTMTTKDLSALSPISFKDQILVQANVDFEKDDEKILSVRDEVETVIDNLLEQLPPESMLSSEQKQELINSICKKTKFVNPYFFSGSYGIFSFSDIYIIGILFAIAFVHFIIYSYNPIYAIISAAFFSLYIYFLNYILKYNLKNISILLAQMPIPVNIILVGSLIIIGVISLSFLVPLLFYLLPFTIVVLIILGKDSGKEAFTTKYLIHKTKTYIEEEWTEKNLMTQSSQAMCFTDWNKLYLRKNISKDYFHTIISYVLAHGFLPSTINNLNDIHVSLGGLLKKQVFEDVYLIYDNKEEQNTKSSFKWTYASNKSKPTRKLDDITCVLANIVFGKPVISLGQNLLLPCSGRIKLFTNKAIGASS